MACFRIAGYVLNGPSASASTSRTRALARPSPGTSCGFAVAGLWLVIDYRPLPRIVTIMAIANLKMIRASCFPSIRSSSTARPSILLTRPHAGVMALPNAMQDPATRAIEALSGWRCFTIHEVRSDGRPGIR